MYRSDVRLTNFNMASSYFGRKNFLSNLKLGGIISFYNLLFLQQSIMIKDSLFKLDTPG
jgi:hypothetical protein